MGTPRSNVPHPSSVNETRAVVMIACVSVDSHANFIVFLFRRSRRQDVMHGNPLTQCRGFNLKGK